MENPLWFDHKKIVAVPGRVQHIGSQRILHPSWNHQDDRGMSIIVLWGLRG